MGNFGNGGVMEVKERGGRMLQGLEEKRTKQSQSRIYFGVVLICTWDVTVGSYPGPIRE